MRRLSYQRKILFASYDHGEYRYRVWGNGDGAYWGIITPPLGYTYYTRTYRTGIEAQRAAKRYIARKRREAQRAAEQVIRP